MDIQFKPTSLKAYSGKKLIVNHSRLMSSVKLYLKKIKYFNMLYGMNLSLHIYKPFTLIIIMRSKTSLTDC